MVPLSPYLDKTAFSYELLSRFLEGILDGSHLGKLDLVDGFFALKVKESQRQYLGFSLENEQGILEYYEFCVLPQGITTAPFISRFTLAITSYLRRTLFMVLFITYLDDLGWAIRPGYTPEERTRINEYIRLTFVRAGWVLSETKSIFANNVTELIYLVSSSALSHVYRSIFPRPVRRNICPSSMKSSKPPPALPA